MRFGCIRMVLQDLTGEKTIIWSLDSYGSFVLTACGVIKFMIIINSC